MLLTLHHFPNRHYQAKAAAAEDTRGGSPAAVDVKQMVEDAFAARGTPAAVDDAESGQGDETEPEGAGDDDGDEDDSAAADAADAQAKKQAEGEREDDDAELETLREAGKGYGLSDEELDEFESAEELERTLRVFDRQFSLQGQAAREQAARDAEAAAKADKGGKDDSAQSKTPEPEEFKLDWGEDAEDFSPQFRKSVEGIAKQNHELRQQVHSQNERLQKMETFLAAYHEEQEAENFRKVTEQFDGFVQSAKLDDLFGDDPARLTKTQQANRVRVWESVNDILAGAQANGREVYLSEALVQRVIRGEFADQIQKQHQQQKAKALRQQSQRRIGRGSSATTKRAKTGSVKYDGPASQNPALHQYFQDLLDAQH